MKPMFLITDEMNNTPPFKYITATIVEPSMSVIPRKNETKVVLVNFNHRTVFSPVKSTITRLINNGR